MIVKVKFQGQVNKVNFNRTQKNQLKNKVKRRPRMINQNLNFKR